MDENQISRMVVNSALKIHKRIGPGLLEAVYENILAYELKKQGLKVLQQVNVPLKYETMEFKTAYRLDLLVENKVILELKSVERLAPLHTAQILTYLKLTGLKLGLLINFNTAKITHGIHRYVNKL